MKYSLAAVASFAAAAFAQEVPSPAVPAPGGAPAGCVPDYSGTFGISNTLLPGATSPKSKRTPPSEGVGHALYLTLAGGILYDSNTPPRFGYIASNEQLQFDNPIQAGGIYTEGWSLCPNQTLALGDTTVFYQCQSGEFYNIYFTPAGASCIPIELTIVPSGMAVSSVPPTGASSTSVYVPSSSVAVSSSSVAVSSSSSVMASPSAVSSSSAVVTSSAAAPSSSAPAPAPSTSAAPTSSAASVTSSIFPGAAPTMALDASYFAVAAGAVAMAMF